MKNIIITVYPAHTSFEKRLAILRRFTGEADLTKKHEATITKVIDTLIDNERYWMAESLNVLAKKHPNAFKALLWATRATPEGSSKTIVEAFLYGHWCHLCGGSLVCTNACAECKLYRRAEWKKLHRTMSVQSASRTNLERYGVENVFASEKIKKKIKKTCLSRYGVRYPTQSDEVRKKTENTNLERYGCRVPAQSKKVLAAMQQTCIERFGVKNPGMSASVRTKMKTTSMVKYGVNNPAKSDVVQAKMAKTNMSRYGAPNPFASSKIQKKVKQTMLRRYGVEHPMHNSEFQQKQLKARYKILEFTQGKKSFKCQGTYELALIPKLITRFGVANVYTQFSKKFPSDAREYVGFTPDFYIASKDTFVEMKSMYTLVDAKGMWDLNRSKAQKAGKKVVWIVMHKGRFVTLPRKWYNLSAQAVKDLICL